MASGPCLRRCRVVRRYMPIKLLDYRVGVKPEYSIHVPMYFESFREGNTVNTGGLCPQVPIHRKLGSKNVGKFYSLHIFYISLIFNHLFILQTLSAKKRRDFLQFGGAHAAISSWVCGSRCSEHIKEIRDK